jgi:hypothetical protein
MIDRRDEQKQNPQPAASPTPVKEPVKPVVEDLQLKKALEILQEKSQAARSGE